MENTQVLERTDHSGHDEEHENDSHIPIFIDGTKYFAPDDDMTGAELKQLGHIPDDYQLFLEVPGPAPDEGIRDDEVVELKPGMRFNGVVPGTLG